MKFIADAMLGRLARWLRLLGFDTLYYPDISDQQVLKISREQERFILTRDTHFIRRNIKDSLMIHSDSLEEQVAQVLRDLNLALPAAGRCANCNGILKDVPSKSEVRDSVPEHVYLTHSLFQRCAGCGNIYWEGTQYRRFRERLKDMLHSTHGGHG
jgi:uncharacterized protein with PIN domain